VNGYTSRSRVAGAKAATSSARPSRGTISINTTRVSPPIEADGPGEEVLFGEHWAPHGTQGLGASGGRTRVMGLPVWTGVAHRLVTPRGRPDQRGAYRCGC
jgi:hypothetical protein